MVSKEQLADDLKQAMRSGDEVAKRTLRMALTAIKLAEVERREPLDEGALLTLLQKELKTRQETVEEARQAGREALVASTEAEIEILKAYLPAQLSDEELKALAREAIEEAGATSPGDMGKVMKVLMPKLGGRADGRAASAAVRALLGNG